MSALTSQSEDVGVDSAAYRNGVLFTTVPGTIGKVYQTAHVSRYHCMADYFRNDKDEQNSISLVDLVSAWPDWALTEGMRHNSIFIKTLPSAVRIEA